MFVFLKNLSTLYQLFILRADDLFFKSAELCKFCIIHHPPPSPHTYIQKFNILHLMVYSLVPS